MKNYYEILGISAKASDQDIKRAYRSLAMRYHPDRNKSHDAHEAFVSIQEAYNTLSDPVKRNTYDYYYGYSSSSTGSGNYTYSNRQQTNRPNYAESFRQRAQEEERKRQQNEVEFEKIKQRSRENKKREDADLFVLLKAVNYVCLFLSLIFFLDICLPKALTKDETVKFDPDKNNKNYHTQHASFRFSESSFIPIYIGDKLSLETTPIFGFVYKVKTVNDQEVTTEPSVKWGPHSIFYMNAMVLIFAIIMELNWLKRLDYDVLIPALSFINILIIVTEVFMIVDILA